MKNALIVAGGWDGHEPKKCAHIMADVLKQDGYTLEMHDSMDVYADEEKMLAFDLIVPIWTMGEVSGDQCKGLLAAVTAGVGIAGFHGGMGDSFRNRRDSHW